MMTPSGIRKWAWGMAAVLLRAGACSGEVGEQGPAGTTPPAGGARGGGGVGGAAGPGGTAGSAPGTGGAPAMTPDRPVLPFEALAAAVYGSKVKNVLTGLPLADDELKALVASAGALPGLIDKWVALPEWRAKTIDFFKQAFEQTQTDINDYDEQLGRTTNPWNNVDRTRFVRSAEESFARTALALIDEGKPFT